MLRDHRRNMFAGISLVLLVSSFAWAQRQPKPPPPVTEFEGYTLPLEPLRGVDPKTAELNDITRDLDSRWDETLFLRVLDRVYDHAQQEFDAFERVGKRPIGKIPEREPDGGGTLSIAPGHVPGLDEFDLGGIDDASDIDQLLEDAGITEEDLGIEDGDEPLSDDELARQLGLEPLDDPAPRTPSSADRGDGAETQVDLLEDARPWGPTPKTGGGPYRGEPGPSLVPGSGRSGARRDSEAIAIAILEALLEEELSLFGEEDSGESPSDPNSDSKTASSDSGTGNRTTTDTDAARTGGRQTDGRSSSGRSTLASNNQPDVLDQILAEQTSDSGGANRSTHAQGSRPVGRARNDADALLDAIASEGQGELKQPGENTFTIDDLFTVDPDEITDQPTIEELLAGFGGDSQQELREQADRYLPPTGQPGVDEFRNQAGQLNQQLTAAQRAAQERLRRQQLDAQRQAQLAEQQRREQAAKYERWRQQQLARQQAVEYERWRQNQIAHQQQIARQQQIAQEQYARQQRWSAFARQVQAISQQLQQPQYRQPAYGGWNSGGYTGRAAPSDGTILGPEYRHGLGRDFFYPQ